MALDLNFFCILVFSILSFSCDFLTADELSFTQNGAVCPLFSHFQAEFFANERDCGKIEQDLKTPGFSIGKTLQ